MNPKHGTTLATRPLLLERLRAGDDNASWQEFYSLYGGLIRSFATKSGLTPEEAEEVVQETAIGVARNLPEFVYDPKVCRFKTWLLNLTRWRILDQIRRRRARGPIEPTHAPGLLARVGRVDSDDSQQTPTVERIPDPVVPDFGAEWDDAWEKNLLVQALERVRGKIDERQFQVFDLCVNKGWAPGQVAQTLRLRPSQVYLIKHRVLAQIKRETRRLEKLASRLRPESGTK